MKTLETAILLPMLLIIIVVMLNLMCDACKTSIDVSGKFSKQSEKWGESRPGRPWGGVSNEIR